MTTKRAAEKAVLAAALEYAQAYEAYSQAFSKNGDAAGYDSDCKRVVPLHPETVAALAVNHAKEAALKDACEALRVASLNGAPRAGRRPNP